MYITIAGVNYTAVIDPGPSNGIAFQASLSDPNSTCDFTLDDINQTIKLKPFSNVVVWDETAPPTYTFSGTAVPTTPAMNYSIGASITAAGALSAIVSLTNVLFNPTVSLTFSNNALGQGYGVQTTLVNLVVPGQQYMLSSYLDCSVALVNAQAFLQINWLDTTQTLISSVSQTYASTHPQVRENISGTAPANAAYAQLLIGGQSTVAGTNSGHLTWSSPQFEPMWFVPQGVNYPTSDLNFAQVGCVMMPDSTVSRKCRIFAGYIEDLVVSYIGKQRYYTVSCAHLSKMLENLGLVNASYTSQFDTQILSNIIGGSTYSGLLSTGQQNAFSPTSTIIQGSLIDSVTYTNNTLREVSNSLADQSGSQFYVDPYAYYWYVPPSFVAQIVQLSDTPDNMVTFPYHDFSVEYDGTQPESWVLVVGSKQQAAAITDTFSGNGVTTVFSLSEPPFTTHTVTIGGVSQRTGIDGVDKLGATFKALVNKQRQIITFGTAPASGSNNVVVTYTYEDQATAQVLSADAIAAANGRPFYILINDNNITSTTTAKNRGLAELTKYAFARTILTLSALNIYVPVGSLLLFTCQAESMAATPFTIQTVSSKPQGGGQYVWDYTAGAYNPTIVDHIRNMHKAVKRSPTTSNVVVISSIDVALFDHVHLNDSIVMNANGAPPSGPYIYDAYGDAALADSPQVYYRLAEASGSTAKDSSTHANNGTYNGTVTYSQLGALVHDVNSAVLLDASTAFVSMPVGVNPHAWANWTFELWFNISATFSDYPRILANDRPSATGNGFELMLAPAADGASGYFNFETNTSGSAGFGFGTGALSNNTWYHIALTYDGATITLYLNGVFQNSEAATGVLNASAQVINVGRNPQYGGDYFGGIVDEVALYSTALSAGRISTHYQYGTTPNTRYGFASYA